MISKRFQPQDMVALMEDLPAKNLYRGQVGKVVEMLTDDIFDVEFADKNGEVYATATLRTPQVMRLLLEPVS